MNSSDTTKIITDVAEKERMFDVMVEMIEKYGTVSRVSEVTGLKASCVANFMRGGRLTSRMCEVFEEVYARDNVAQMELYRYRRTKFEPKVKKPVTPLLEGKLLQERSTTLARLALDYMGNVSELADVLDVPPSRLRTILNPPATPLTKNKLVGLLVITCKLERYLRSWHIKFEPRTDFLTRHAT